MTTQTLNPGQAAGARAFFEFLLTDEKTFVISGTAGVGKTFLMHHLANNVMKQYERDCHLMEVKPAFDEAIFTATTNKAAEVLETALGAPVSTIHSMIGLIVKDDYKTGKQKLERGKNHAIRHRKILFIDECSMIDKDLYAEIMYAFKDSKIVFVGDHAQMAPVGESISELYKHVKPDNVVVLTEPVRNAGQPALVALCAQLRKTVETGIFQPIQEVPGVIDYLTPADMEEGLNYFFSSPDPSCRILAFTNSRVADYNSFIREDIRKRPSELQTGDLCVVVQIFQKGRLILNVEREVEILSVGPVEEDTDFHYEHPILFRRVTAKVKGGVEMPDLPVAENPAYIRELVKKEASRKNWSAYFDLKGRFLNVQDKSSCTVYKAQGSTYDSVFVDLGNIGTSFDAEQVARMLFVAISRARNRVFLYGSLPGQYHNSKGKPLWQPEVLLFSENTSSSPSITASSSPNIIASPTSYRA